MIALLTPAMAVERRRSQGGGELRVELGELGHELGSTLFVESEFFLGEGHASVEDERQIWKPLQALLELVEALLRGADVLIEFDDERGQGAAVGHAKKTLPRPSGG